MVRGWLVRLTTRAGPPQMHQSYLGNMLASLNYKVPENIDLSGCEGETVEERFVHYVCM